MRNMTKYLFKDENVDSSAFKIHRRHFIAGTKFAPHWHDYLELEIIISGTLEHNYNNAINLFESGNAYVISYHDFHEWTALTDAELVCIQFNNNFLDADISQYLSINSVLYRFTEDEFQKTLEQLDTMLEMQNTTFVFRHLYIKNILSELILLMIKNSVQQNRTSTPLPIQQIIAYIADNYLQKITLEDIAQKFSYYPNYLGKLLKKQTGYNFNAYLNLLRLKHACNLLQNSKLPVKEVAFQSGYNSVEHFLYSFKKNLQMTPSEYKKLFSTLDIEND